MSTRVVFKGNSCYPLSPLPQYGEIVAMDEHDQMLKILALLDGNQRKKVQYLTDMKEFVQEKSSLDQALNGHSAEMISALSSMLTFDQEDRVDAKSLLQHRIFDPIRNVQQECLSPWEINSEMKEFDQPNVDLRQMIIKAASKD